MYICNKRSLALLLTISLFCCNGAFAAYPNVAEADVAEINKKITPLVESIPAQWRLTMKDDPTAMATVSWSTFLPDGEHVLYYGRRSSAGDLNDYENRVVCQRNGKYSNEVTKKMKRRRKNKQDQAHSKEEQQEEVEPEGNQPPKPTAYYHHARLSGLKPATQYYLTMVSNGVASGEFHFYTAPADRNRLVFLHGGDSRTGIAARSQMNRLISELVSVRPEICALVHGGDYVSSGHSYEQWERWLSQNELITTDENRLVPIIPAKGNHDRGKLIGEIFDFESDGEDDPIYYYDIQFGNHLSMVILDTNIAGTGAQEAFLTDALARLRPKTRWLTAQYHRPLYPAVKTAPAHKGVFVPLFENYDLDLALESDGHVIKRTVPIRNEQKDTTGVVYVGEGGLGVGQRQPKIDRWFINPEEGAYAGQGHHVMLIAADVKMLTIETIGMDGRVLDESVIQARDEYIQN